MNVCVKKDTSNLMTCVSVSKLQLHRVSQKSAIVTWAPFCKNFNYF